MTSEIDVATRPQDGVAPDPDAPMAPRKPAAPGTHPTELQRLALQEQTHPDCDPLAVQSVIWLFRAYNAAIAAQAEELRPLDLSPSAFNVLMALLNTPGQTLEPCELAERLLISRPSITGLLDTLQGKQLIQRHPHSADRRRVLVALTQAGRDLLDRHFPVHYREQNALLADLSPAERATLVTLLRRVRGAAPEHLADGSRPSPVGANPTGVRDGRPDVSTL
jgi:DNA-binding MarR family transcriptional regulator